MTYLETRAMSRQFLEAEAVLFRELRSRAEIGTSPGRIPPVPSVIRPRTRAATLCLPFTPLCYCPFPYVSGDSD